MDFLLLIAGFVTAACVVLPLVALGWFALDWHGEAPRETATGARGGPHAMAASRTGLPEGKELP